jgi:hypothetical protein
LQGNREVSKKPKEVKAQAASAAQASKILTGKDEIARLKKIIETMKASTTSSSSSSSSSSDLARSSGTSSGIDLSLSSSSVPVNSVSSSHSAPYPYPSLYTVSPPPVSNSYRPSKFAAVVQTPSEISKNLFKDTPTNTDNESNNKNKEVTLYFFR